MSKEGASGISDVEFYFCNSSSLSGAFTPNPIVTLLQTNHVSCNDEGAQYAVILMCHLRKWSLKV